MKTLIIANNQKWFTWAGKLEAIKAWFSDSVKLDIDIVDKNYKSIPFEGYTRTDTKEFQGLWVKKDWFTKNIIPLAKGYDIVLLSMDETIWQGKNLQGIQPYTIDGVRCIQIGSNETGDYNFNGVRYSGDKWFNIARHEICHAIYDILGKEDNTHKYWQAGTIDKCLEEFKDTKQVITLARTDYLLTQTLGTLSFGNFKCKTLERPWKDNTPNISCIPAGTYNVEWTFSPKFMKYTYEIKNVPRRSGIRIHSGNYFYQIQGCVLLGDTYSDINKDGSVDVLNSKLTIAKFEQLMNKKPFTLVIK